jgi:hypothetical protein
VNTLQFIDAMTGRLAWPIAAVVLGLVFRTPLIRLLARVRRFRWREAEAELAEAAEAVEEAAKEAAAPLPPGVEESAQENRERIDRLLIEAAEWGFQLAAVRPGPVPPNIRVKWESGQPRLQVFYRKEALLRGANRDISDLMDELIRREAATRRAAVESDDG